MSRLSNREALEEFIAPGVESDALQPRDSTICIFRLVEKNDRRSIISHRAANRMNTFFAKALDYRRKLC